MSKFIQILEALQDETLIESNNQKIANLLKKGFKVRSAAAGRVGTVIAAEKGNVTVQRKNKKGITSFDDGDEVKIEKHGDEYVIVNKGE